MSMKKISAIALALTMSVGMLTACGDTEDSSKETTTTTTTTAATTTTAPETTTTSAEAEPEEDPVEDPVEALAGVSYNEPFTSEPAPAGVTTATITFEPIGVEGTDAAYWNDYCTFKFCVTDKDGNVDWHAVIGAAVSWDVTVDNNGTEDDTSDDTGFPPAECLTMWTDENLVVDVNVAEGSTITVTALGWNDTEESSATPYFNVLSIEYK